MEEQAPPMFRFSLALFAVKLKWRVSPKFDPFLLRCAKLTSEQVHDSPSGHIGSLWVVGRVVKLLHVYTIPYSTLRAIAK